MPSRELSSQAKRPAPVDSLRHEETLVSIATDAGAAGVPWAGRGKSRALTATPRLLSNPPTMGHGFPTSFSSSRMAMCMCCARVRGEEVGSP